jgi:predicted nucleotidyltransferase
MKENIQRLRKELKDPLECLYGQRLKGVFLFGSYARGEADAESDMDVLIVLDHVNNYSNEIERTETVISELSLKFGTTISRVFASEQRWQTDQTNFFQNVREEAVPA